MSAGRNDTVCVCRPDTHEAQAAGTGGSRGVAERRREMLLLAHADCALFPDTDLTVAAKGGTVTERG